MDMKEFAAKVKESAARGDDLVVNVTENAVQFAEFVLNSVKFDGKSVVNASMIHRVDSPQNITYAITVRLPDA